MAEGDGAIYNYFKTYLMGGLYNLANGGNTLKMMLVHGYTPNIDTHTKLGDVSASDYTTALGYTAAGKALTGQAISQDNAADRGAFDANDVAWTGLGPLATNPPSHCILYNDSDVTTPKGLICYWELGVTLTNGGDYTLVFGAKIIYLT